MVVLCLDNGRLPFVFLNCQSQDDFSRAFLGQRRSMEEWEEATDEITFCTYDSTTRMVAVSLATQEV